MEGVNEVFKGVSILFGIKIISSFLPKAYSEKLVTVYYFLPILLSASSANTLNTTAPAATAGKPKP
ncbi:MAG: hypothetical protein Q8M58_10955, partial [Anaerolineales bacterium]|nr:hypothetical protein [Anaerolineales bacterium]